MNPFWKMFFIALWIGGLYLWLRWLIKIDELLDKFARRCVAVVVMLAACFAITEALNSL